MTGKHRKQNSTIPKHSYAEILIGVKNKLKGMKEFVKEGINDKRRNEETDNVGIVYRKVM